MAHGGLHRGKKVTACRREADLAGGAIEQAERQHLFQLSDELAYGLRRHAQALCGAGEAAQFCHADEGFQLAQGETQESHDYQAQVDLTATFIAFYC